MNGSSKKRSVFWDRMARRYDVESGQGLIDPAHEEIWLGILDRTFPFPRRARILDVGCGTGFLSLLLAETGRKAVGLDFSRSMLAVAREKAADLDRRIDLVAGEVQSPPFEAGSFDHVICRHIMWTLPDPWLVLSNLRRALKPGGSLVLLEGYWKLRNPFTRARFYLGDWIRVWEEGRKPPGRPWKRKGPDDRDLPRFQGSPSAVLAGILEQTGFIGIFRDRLELLTAYERSRMGWGDRIKYLGLKERRYLVGGRKP